MQPVQSALLSPARSIPNPARRPAVSFSGNRRHSSENPPSAKASTVKALLLGSAMAVLGALVYVHHHTHHAGHQAAGHAEHQTDAPDEAEAHILQLDESSRSLYLAMSLQQADREMRQTAARYIEKHMMAESDADKTWFVVYHLLDGGRMDSFRSHQSPQETEELKKAVIDLVDSIRSPRIRAKFRELSSLRGELEATFEKQDPGNLKLFADYLQVKRELLEMVVRQR